MKTSECITYIPSFMKKTKATNAQTNDPKIDSQTKPIKRKSTQNLEEYQKLKRDIFSYFRLMNEAQKEYYFNLDYNRNSEYQKYTNRVQLSTTKIVSGDIEPYMEEFQKELEEKGVQLTYSFPLRGEVGFVTAKNKIGS